MATPNGNSPISREEFEELVKTRDPETIVQTSLAYTPAEGENKWDIGLRIALTSAFSPLVAKEMLIHGASIYSEALDLLANRWRTPAGGETISLDSDQQKALAWVVERCLVRASTRISLGGLVSYGNREVVESLIRHLSAISHPISIESLLSVEDTSFVDWIISLSDLDSIYLTFSADRLGYLREAARKGLFRLMRLMMERFKLEAGTRRDRRLVEFGAPAYIYSAGREMFLDLTLLESLMIACLTPLPPHLSCDTIDLLLGEADERGWELKAMAHSIATYFDGYPIRGKLPERMEREVIDRIMECYQSGDVDVSTYLRDILSADRLSDGSTDGSIDGSTDLPK